MESRRGAVQVFWLLAAAIAVIAVANGEVVNFKLCPDVPSDMCTIHEVRVDPCPQAATNAACHFPRRKPAQNSFEFTPNFDADTLDASLVWVKSDTEELPLLTLDRNACAYTTCPVRRGQRQTYSIDVPIEKKFPLSYYTIKWALTAPSGEKCCYTIDIKVVR